eukprot:gb/GEZN01012089.1/.p1 GENE.gb/GEZN01012089.1/~~gb/GEZN01012089.1/.p1  ORF type:complete len:348 (-),score=63.40 gb/GEZN01012089.1/:66-1109(-)
MPGAYMHISAFVFLDEMGCILMGKCFCNGCQTAQTSTDVEDEHEDATVAVDHMNDVKTEREDNKSGVLPAPKKTQIVMSFGSRGNPAGGEESGYEIALRFYQTLGDRLSCGREGIYFDSMALQSRPGTYVENGKIMNPRWAEYYREAVKEAKLFVFCFTDAWLNSKFCQEEFVWMLTLRPDIPLVGFVFEPHALDESKLGRIGNVVETILNRLTVQSIYVRHWSLNTSISPDLAETRMFKMLMETCERELSGQSDQNTVAVNQTNLKGWCIDVPNTEEAAQVFSAYNLTSEEAADVAKNASDLLSKVTEEDLARARAATKQWEPIVKQKAPWFWTKLHPEEPAPDAP